MRRASEQLARKHAFNFTILSLPLSIGCGFHKWRCNLQASATMFLYLLRADDSWIVPAAHVIESSTRIK